jgi:uncharacterized protein YbjT (DUF2867 family)
VNVFITGATGYLGRTLIPNLLERGHRVRALVRQQSVGKLPHGADPVVGNALDAATFESLVSPSDTFVQLVGTPHPGPGKREEFRSIDLVSVRASVAAAKRGNVSHFVYVSVAQPSRLMAAYVAVRAEGERLIADAGLTATYLRPWYVLGPGHRWPILLLPLYGIASLIPSLREGAERAGLVTISQMTNALVHAVENPPPHSTQRIVTVRHIRATKS